MSISVKKRRKPAITMGIEANRRLSNLAMAIEERMPEIADALLQELDRARLVPDAKLPDKVVRLGSTVEFATNGDQPRRITLVMPAEADIAQGRISIATPIGVALIGLSEGQSMTAHARDGRENLLTVMKVSAPQPAEAG
ncbi:MULTISPECIES: nucleoside diphosphate kinase regulator [Oceanibaculum]|uniref:Nucleoside diphosphate kinase regulator n=2 Tax=Oceanibaculum indicum TaxID=526216 RepID=K2J0T1_9PROT|nr:MULTISPECIES: nucleoside diphosphate kinase regulator [Oceanibaculum]EKE76531.1 nucleoside diphosphate kinase regulator [Oceanibaculum indicum P24]MCH2393953.1 nucleoside diphosphate kinase regulator [Oceanibaculum sp.]RKQ70516.1 regulator of nucleoside diphosphate kinase [Oceanibaculum indicum]